MARNNLLIFFSLFLLLLMANEAFARNRMLMVEEGKGKESLEIGNYYADGDGGEPGMNNHHSIPRQSWDNSQQQQHGPSQSNQTPDIHT
ncbi:putative pectate lyase 12 protein [Corchorus capsularis]|uniref:Putative pectate lyase 12 protein n=1 Tax=Corchorus capsularis TaxID=210143 RepID=A0A1R3IGT8_COCAP|nr:putative pectate lyase 12 protein [Corchorus capsularis]